MNKKIMIKKISETRLKGKGTGIVVFNNFSSVVGSNGREDIK